MKVNIRPSFLLLEALIILWYLNPIASLLPNYTVIFVFFAWFFWEIMNKKNLVKIFETSWIHFIIFVVVFLRCYFANRFDIDEFWSPIHVAIRRYEIFACSALAVYVNTLGREDRDRIFSLSIIGILITVIFSLYYVLFVNVLAIRYSQIDIYWGIADFQYIYAISILVGPFAMMSFDKSRVCKFRSLCIVTSILMYLCILVCNLVTSIVIAVLSTFFAFIFEYKLSTKGILIILSVFVGFLGKNILGEFLIKLAQSNVLFKGTNDKLITVANLIIGHQGDLNTLDNRMDLISISMNTFKTHPLLGVNFNNYSRLTVGCHSQWPDDLARFGILGNFVIIISYIKLIKENLKNSRTLHIKNSLMAAWATLAVLGFLNPCLAGQIIAIPLIVIPCMYDKETNLLSGNYKY